MKAFKSNLCYRYYPCRPIPNGSFPIFMPLNIGFSFSKNIFFVPTELGVNKDYIETFIDAVYGERGPGMSFSHKKGVLCIFEKKGKKYAKLYRGGFLVHFAPAILLREIPSELEPFIQDKKSLLVDVCRIRF